MEIRCHDTVMMPLFCDFIGQANEMCHHDYISRLIASFVAITSNCLIIVISHRDLLLLLTFTNTIFPKNKPYDGSHFRFFCGTKWTIFIKKVQNKKFHG